jgi:hypothetical protein
MVMWLGALLLQSRQIIPVHGEDKIKLTEVIGSDLTGFGAGDLVSTFFGSN